MSARIAMHGAAGRMGRAIVNVIAGDPDAELCAAVDRSAHGGVGVDAGVLAGLSEPIGVPVTADVVAAVGAADVLIDFTLPEGTRTALEACAATRCGAVVGTTGLGADGRAAIDALAKVAPVVFASNYSVGVNALWALARQAAAMLGDEFDMEIIEMHHHHKVDAPSGTAVTLAEVVAEARGVGMDQVVYGRSGFPGARPRREIGVHALRGGDVVGEHTLVLAGPGERLELTHRAHTREIFARGAVRAAKWLVGRPPGLYGMRDVLGIG